jgi:hypothetical protein
MVRPSRFSLPPGRTGWAVSRWNVLVRGSFVTFMLSQTYGAAASQGIQKTYTLYVLGFRDMRRIRHAAGGLWTQRVIVTSWREIFEFWRVSMAL